MTHDTATDGGGEPAPEPEPEPEPETTWPFTQGHELLPGYVAWDLLGQGRRFEMWAAWCRDRMTPVCVKVPRRDAFTPSTCQALERELAAASAVSHPAIPRVFAAELGGPLPHIVYELIEGRPLSLILDDDGPLDAHDTVFVGLQLAAALRHVHQRGYVHLDVKPSNVVLRGDRAVLLDFDIALPVGVRRSGTRPRGTTWYMAPEQVRCAPADPAMDLFALGVLLYEVATAERLYDLPTDEQPTDSDEMPTRFPQLDGDHPDVAALAPELPPGLAAAIQALLAPDPAQRPAADDAIVLLEAALPPGSEPLWPDWVTRSVLGAPAPARQPVDTRPAVAG